MPGSLAESTPRSWKRTAASDGVGAAGAEGAVEGADALARECDVFCRHLLGRPTDPYVRRKYAEGHLAGVVDRPEPAALDAPLVRFASLGPLAAHMADAYARLVDPSTLLRRKLVLLLAILESAPATHAAFSHARRESPARAAARLAAAGVGFLTVLVAGIVVLLPVHVAVRLRGALRRARRSGRALMRADVV